MAEMGDGGGLAGLTGTSNLISANRQDCNPLAVPRLPVPRQLFKTFHRAGL